MPKRFQPLNLQMPLSAICSTIWSEKLNIKKIIKLLVFSIFLYSCTSISEVPESDYIDSSNEVAILEECKKDILKTSPECLQETLKTLSESNAGKTETGIIYSYISYQLLYHVYPALLKDLEESQASRTIYNYIFSEIEAGNMPKLEQDNANFLTSMIIPIIVLYSDDKDIEESALDMINQSIQINDESVLSLFLRGYIFERNFKYTEALSDYYRALEFAPSCYPAQVGIARISAKTGNPIEGVEIIDKLMAKYPDAIEILLAASKIYFWAEKQDEALELTYRVLDLEANNYQALLMQAQIYLHGDNIEQATRLIEIINKEKIEEPDYFIIKSSIEKQNKDIEAAIKTLEEGQRKYPDNKLIEQAYGTVLMQAGRKEEARNILINSGDNEGNNTEGLIALIDDAIASNDRETALYFSDKLALEASSLAALLKSWSVSFEYGEYEKALATATQLFKQFPTEIDTKTAYCKSLLSLNQVQQATKIINKALETEEDPENRSILFFLKSETEKSNDKKLEHLKSALFEDLKNIEALLSISKLYKKRGESLKAYRYLKQALELSPDNQEIKAELSILEAETR